MPFDATQSPKHLAATLLRNTDKKQCEGEFYHCGEYCALGVLAPEALGMTDTEMNRKIPYAQIEEWLGIEVDPIYEMNDQGASFSEIADWLESQ